PRVTPGARRGLGAGLRGRRASGAPRPDDAPGVADPHPHRHADDHAPDPTPHPAPHAGTHG
ncbi:hydrogenase accessory protein HypB, partial [Streptomyces sp. NPDC056639]